MVIEWIFGLVRTIVGFVLGLMPPMPDISSFTAQITSGVSTLSDYAGQLGHFVPWSYVTGCVQAVFASLAIAVIIKIVRIVASFVTAGGGSAA